MPEACGVFGRSRELGAVAAFLDGLPSGPSGLTDRGRSRDRQDDGVDGRVADAAARSYLVLSARPTE
jgi:hypothetical protein